MRNAFWIICVLILVCGLVYLLFRKPAPDQRRARYEQYKFGCLDKSGKIVVAPVFDSIGEYSDGYAAAVFKAQACFIDRSGKLTDTGVNRFDKTLPFCNGFAPVQIGDKWGFVDTKFRMIVPVKYETVSEFHEGMAGVELGGLFGFVNEKGEMSITPCFGAVGRFYEGLAQVKTPEYWIFEPKSGKKFKRTQISSIQYNDGDSLYSASVRSAIGSLKWGLIDETGKFVLPADSDQPIQVRGDRALLMTKSGSAQWRKFNLSDPRLGQSSHDTDEAWSTTQPGIAKTMKLSSLEKLHKGPLNSYVENGKYGLKNKDGAIVLPAIFDDIVAGDQSGFFRNSVDGEPVDIDSNGKIGFRGVRLSSGGRAWKVHSDNRFIDKTGRFVGPPSIDSCLHFSVGIAPVKMGNLWGAIDRTGKLVITPKFLALSNFADNGLAAAKKGEKWGFVNFAGLEIIPFKYDDVRDFCGQRAAVCREGKWGFIDAKGTELIALRFDGVCDFSEGRAVCLSKGTQVESNNFQILDQEGKTIVSHWMYACPYSSGLAAIALDPEHWNFVDLSGKFLFSEPIYQPDQSGLRFRGDRVVLRLPPDAKDLRLAKE